MRSRKISGMMPAMNISKQARQVVTVARVIGRQPREATNVARLLRTRKRSTLDVRLPWLPFAVIDVLEERVDRESRIFEYGGGGSTAWFADRAGEVVTVEHDEGWHKALVEAMSPRSNVNIVWAAELRDYAATIDRYDEQLFDVVVVDGRERIACIEHAMRWVNPGGLLILDDSARPKYAKADALLQGWPKRDYFGLVPCKDQPGDTTIWTRPLQAAPHVGSGERQ
jgi:predicted O-methyltransferase YrrM